MKMKEMGEKRGNEDELLMKLEEISHRGWFLWKIFLFCTIPSILNGLNLTSYIYLAEVPQHWCSVPELKSANWTEEEIRNVSSPGGGEKSSCFFYQWDYSMLASMTYEDALSYVQSNKLPSVKPCSGYSYAEGISSMVVDYDLVCDRIALKSTIQMTLSLGKFAGAFFFGIISDKYGRRLSFLVGSFLYIISGPMVSFAVNYGMIIAGRIGLGAAGSAIYHSAYVILIEIVDKNKRASLSTLYNMSYPIGQMIVPLIAYFIRDWRELQLVISVPALMTLFFYWLLPESPRWLISSGKRAEAARFINKFYTEEMKKKFEAKMKLKAESSPVPARKPLDCEESLELPLQNITDSAKTEDPPSPLRGLWLKLTAALKQFVELVRHSELRNRLFITLFAWCVCSLSYYALALNVDNFHTNRYIYGFLTGLVEVPSYLLPLPLLKYLGRRYTSIPLFYVGGVALVGILMIPRTPEYNIFLLVVASIGRLCTSAVFAVVILHSTELFPTLVRNTAIGLGSTAAHIGSMSAPFLVDLLGAYAWFIPSTVCGMATLIAGTCIFLLPETKNKPLPDTIQDIVNAPKESKLGFHQICS
ncbi:UNVERIFIED_CONTAM: hypothetical protein PYX00_009302 [Menopon gallinae]|uniref:Major facilitator superfamily (MFS) profile domain-containing protein n=1 Tax=Menopon gallinae TaxID=328185 RepID=A0AAW2HBD4_9NEOP